MGVIGLPSFRNNVLIGSVTLLTLPFVMMLFAALASLEAVAQPKPPAVVVAQMQRLARYTMAKLEPDQAQQNPLASTISIHLPRESVQTVGDAVRYLLLRTGYRLADGLPNEVAEVLALSLPDVHRQLGPYSVTEALNVLLGAAYALDIDPSRRMVAYRALNGDATNTTPVASALSSEPSGVSTSGPRVVASREQVTTTPISTNPPSPK
jgi:conjugative transfer region protein (TIGR03748 family)